MRAWWAYWLMIIGGAVLWIGTAIFAGADGLRAIVSQPLWLAILLLPFTGAGLNLILFRESHEEICRLEVERHPWLRYAVGKGYSAAMFGWTGVALLGFVVVVIVTVL